MPQITQEQIDAAIRKVRSQGTNEISLPELSMPAGGSARSFLGNDISSSLSLAPPPPPDLDDEQGLSEFITNAAQMAQEASALKLAEQPEEIGAEYTLGDTPQVDAEREQQAGFAALEQAAMQQELQGRREDVSQSMPGAQEVAPGQFYQGPEHLPVGDVGHVPYGTGGVSGEYDANIKRIPGRSATVRPGRGTLSMSEPAESIPQHPEEKLKHFQQKAELAQAQAAQEQFEAQKRESELPAEQRAALAAARLGKPAPSTHPAELLAAQLVQAGLANGEITSIEDAIAKLQAFQSGSIDLSGFDTTPALPPAS